MFEPDKRYSLGCIQVMLGIKSRDTLYSWIRDGLLVNRVVSGTAVKVRVKLGSRKVGHNYQSYGREVEAFLLAINRSAA